MMSEQHAGTSSEGFAHPRVLPPSVERVDPSEMETVARVLAHAYTEDPIHLWAMPRESSRFDDAVAFFSFYLRQLRRTSWDVFATSDRSAVVVTSVVKRGHNAYPQEVRRLPGLIRGLSRVNDYFQWLESFRPDMDHVHSEFLGALPTARRGAGFILLANVLRMFDRERLPVWTWSSNPLNLPFYRRLGFEIRNELKRDDDTPPVTVIWRPVHPVDEIAGG
jgi:hypothetical protein